jgi:hypothetical protein
MSTTLKIIATAVFYLITMGTGYVMHKKGRPFNPLLSALHKLIALAVVVLSISLLLLISLFATGAMLSGEREMPPIVLLLHDIATYVSPLTVAVTFILMFKS